jgi:hypothetical protein
MSQWMVLLAVVAALYCAYIVIYSSLALLFGWPKLHKGDWKEMGFGLLVQAVIGIPALLLLEKHFPILSSLRRSLFVIVMIMFVARVFGPKIAGRAS